MDPSPSPTLEYVATLRHPHKRLLAYYALSCLPMGPLFFLPLVALYFRYHTLTYRFDEEGILMRWGILFRREINLTYARVQDIHLVSNLVERWFGLARIQIQTASGSAKAEMTIEGIREFELLRDFLYLRMRGAKGEPASGPSKETSACVGAGGDLAAVTHAIREAAHELQAIREGISASGRVRGEG